MNKKTKKKVRGQSKEKDEEGGERVRNENKCGPSAVPRSVIYLRNSLQDRNAPR